MTVRITGVVDTWEQVDGSIWHRDVAGTLVRWTREEATQVLFTLRALLNSGAKPEPHPAMSIPRRTERHAVVVTELQPGQLVVVANDGTMWLKLMHHRDGKWHRMAALPQEPLCQVPFDDKPV